MAKAFPGSEHQSMVIDDSLLQEAYRAGQQCFEQKKAEASGPAVPVSPPRKQLAPPEDGVTYKQYQDQQCSPINTEPGQCARNWHTCLAYHVPGKECPAYTRSIDHDEVKANLAQVCQPKTPDENCPQKIHQCITGKLGALLTDTTTIDEDTESAKRARGLQDECFQKHYADPTELEHAQLFSAAPSWPI